MACGLVKKKRKTADLRALGGSERKEGKAMAGRCSRCRMGQAAGPGGARLGLLERGRRGGRGHPKLATRWATASPSWAGERDRKGERVAKLLGLKMGQRLRGCQKGEEAGPGCSWC